MDEPLGDFIQRVSPSLKSIDFRAATTSSSGKSRKNVASVIRFSHTAVSSLEEIYRSLEKRWPKVDRPKLRITCQALPFQEWSRILSEFQAGKVSIEKDVIEVKQTNLLEIPAVLHGLRVNTTEWNFAEAAVTGLASPTLETLTGEAKALGYQDCTSLLRTWFDLSAVSGIDSEILVAIPVLARIIQADVDPVGKGEVTVRYHRAIKNLMLNISVLQSYGGLPLDLHNVPLTPEKAKPVSEDLVEFSFPFELSAVRPEYFFYRRLIHSEPTGLDLQEIYDPLQIYWTARQALQNPLVWAFNRFFKLEDLMSQIEDPSSARGKTGLQPQDVYERAVAWLLSLSGMSVVRLEEVEKLTSIDGLTQLNSVDILAYDRQNQILFLIACTIGAPKLEEDLARLKETQRRIYDEVFEGRTIKLRGVMFSVYRDLDIFQKQACGYGIGLVDSARAERFLDWVKRGNPSTAVELLAQLPPLPPR